MVTVITNKLKNQSLEDLPSEPPLRMTKISTGKRDLLRPERPERGIGYQFNQDRRSGVGHTRTRSYPIHNLRRLNCRGLQSDSFTMHATLTCSSNTPPASKKLCRSLSVPEEEALNTEENAPWVPRASNVWQPVKGFYRNRSESSPVESQKLTPNRGPDSTSYSSSSSGAAGVNLISTPPASPTPRPASAFAVLDGLACFKSEGARDASVTPRRTCERNRKEVSLACPPLQRSRSQPCFERARTCGIKRRIEDDFETENKLRPALDLAKMEESSYFRCKDKRRGLRIPKYSNKRDSRGLAAPYFTEQENFILKPIASSPLDAKGSSVMITPTSSPTKQLDSIEPKSGGAIINTKDCRRKTLDRKITADEGVFHLDYDSEIDITSIEEDDFV